MDNPIIKKDLFSITKLLKKDRIAAENAFNALPVETQSELFLNAPDRDRLDLVEMSHAPRQLLENIPAVEVWFTIMRLTPKGALPIINYATPEQLQVVCDIEWWKKDRLELQSIYEWLDYITECGIDRTFEWFDTSDWEQLLWFFKQSIVVFKKDEKDSDIFDSLQWPREEAPITHEGVYYFQALEEKKDALVRRLMELLAKHNLELYSKVCEMCIWDSPAIREEEAFEIKSRRLAEHGFPSFDEAISIYAPLDLKRFKTLKKRPASHNPNFVPRYPLSVLGDKILFINRVLSEASPEVESNFLLEVASIANKLLIAGGIDIDSQSLTRSLVKAIGYINIGLETISGGDVQRANVVIEEHWFVHIFQLGLNEVMKVSRSAVKTFGKGWLSGKKEYLALLEPADRTLILNLMAKRPVLFASGDDLFDENSRDFTTSAELLTAKNSLTRIELIGALVEKHFLKKIGTVFELVKDPEDLRLSGIVATAIINGVLKKDEWVFRPVDTKDLQKFIKKLHKTDDPAVQLDEWANAFCNYVFSKGKNMAKEDKSSFIEFVITVRIRMLDELPATAEKPIPEYISCIWFCAPTT